MSVEMLSDTFRHCAASHSAALSVLLISSFFIALFYTLYHIQLYTCFIQIKRVSVFQIFTELKVLCLFPFGYTKLFV